MIGSYASCTSHGWAASERACMRTPISYLGNGWTDLLGPLTTRLPQFIEGVYLHVLRAHPFYLLGTAERIKLKFGLWLGFYYIQYLHMSLPEMGFRTCQWCMHVRMCINYFQRLGGFIKSERANRVKRVLPRNGGKI